MRTLIAALVYGSDYVKAFDLGVGMAAAALATSGLPGFLQWVFGIVAVFLLGRELLHQYVFTAAWLRQARYEEAELRRLQDGEPS